MKRYTEGNSLTIFMMIWCIAWIVWDVYFGIWWAMVLMVLILGLNVWLFFRNVKNNDSIQKLEWKIEESRNRP